MWFFYWLINIWMYKFFICGCVYYYYNIELSHSFTHSPWVPKETCHLFRATVLKSDTDKPSFSLWSISEKIKSLLSQKERKCKGITMCHFLCHRNCSLWTSKHPPCKEVYSELSIAIHSIKNVMQPQDWLLSVSRSVPGKHQFLSFFKIAFYDSLWTKETVTIICFRWAC